MKRVHAGCIIAAGVTSVFAAHRAYTHYLENPDSRQNPGPAVVAPPARPSSKADSPPPPSALANQIQAAIDTANDNSPTSSCGTIAQNVSGSNDGFYWEIGDQNGIIRDSTSGLIAAGSVQPRAANGSTYTRSSTLSIASGSKWLYGAYVAETQAQRSGGSWTMPANDVPFLHFTSGYENMADNCSTLTTSSIWDCINNPNDLSIPGAPFNGSQTPADSGKFYYNGGHLEVFEGGGDPTIANVINAAGISAQDLGNAVQGALAAHSVYMNLAYTSADPAGGVMTTAGDYAAFLQGLIRSNDPLDMRYFLKPTAADPYAVCTNPYDRNCVDRQGNPAALYSPLPPNVSWHYSITHWIEDDPSSGIGAGDGSYSSPGKLGFYPWVDKTFTYYGIVAREDHNEPVLPQNAPFYLSDQCGEAIRTAFFTGKKQG